MVARNAHGGDREADRDIRLLFKSSDNTPGNSSDTNAVICSDTKSYHVRQVNTSNSLYITQPKEVPSSDHGPSSTGVQCTAKNDFTLELLSITPHVDNVKPYIQAALPIYSSTGHLQSKPPVTRDQLFADIPFSYAECLHAYEEMACFELEQPHGCCIPSGQVKLQAWQSIMEEAAVHHLDLTGPVSVTQASNLISQANDLPDQVVKAVWNAMTTENTQTQELTIDEESCVKFLGLSKLQASTQEQGSTSKSLFMASWRDLLPEKWRNTPKLDILKGQYALVNENRDLTLAGSLAERQQQGDSGKAASADGKSMLGAKRKWHEKFRASKKAA